MDNILVSPENLYQEIEISEDVSEGLPGIFWCPKCKGGAGWLRTKTVCASEEADSGALTWRRPIGPQQECPWTVGVLPTYVPTYLPARLPSMHLPHWTLDRMLANLSSISSPFVQHGWMKSWPMLRYLNLDLKIMEATHQPMIVRTPLRCLALSSERATQHQQRIHVMTKVKYFPGTSWFKCKLCVIALLQGEVLLKKVVYVYRTVL